MPGLDLDYDEGQLAIIAALEGFCAEHAADDTIKAATGRLPRDLWRGLAELGVLAAGAPGGDAGALEVCAVMEALGRAVFPGPLAASFLAAQVLPEAERVAVSEGRAIVSAGRPPLMPWAREAEIFLALGEDGSVHRCDPPHAIESVRVLGGEPWGRCDLAVPAEALPRSRQGLVLHSLASAAYLAAAGARLIGDAAEHARSRQQFGRPIGEFQAVAHPLAAAQLRLDAATSLARRAAFLFEGEQLEPALQAAAGARLSASAAAVGAAHVAHQVFGAIGITLEGPAYHISRRIRQLASDAPGPDWARRVVLTPFVGGTAPPAMEGASA